ncbi:hypothetical protein CBR_g38460 [Chara braunii]|uniref:Secretory immunoglobulin A-binding protein EsiB n=1 Tax=Chara braunii TaxID=69332 RepID=A0A388JNT4_CHABU|nr:hypothetical protein CBR_g38460 [Chara braunii]|eukprot:GBG59435.1 hypothetical protein CBR_g38460 [Chara braunii]
MPVFCRTMKPPPCTDVTRASLASDLPAEEQVRLGQSYLHGKNKIAKDEIRAVMWFALAAEKCDAAGMYWLGLAMEEGRGVRMSTTKAARWYKRAAAQGHGEALFRLGQCYRMGKGRRRDMSKAMECFRKAADRGIAEAQLELGHCYRFGVGVAQDESCAMEWYRRAAELGHLAACNNVDDKLNNSLKEAAGCTEAAEKGDSTAPADEHDHDKVFHARLNTCHISSSPETEWRGGLCTGHRYTDSDGDPGCTGRDGNYKSVTSGLIALWRSRRRDRRSISSLPAGTQGPACTGMEVGGDDDRNTKSRVTSASSGDAVADQDSVSQRLEISEVHAVESDSIGSLCDPLSFDGALPIDDDVINKAVGSVDNMGDGGDLREQHGDEDDAGDDNAESLGSMSGEVPDDVTDEPKEKAKTAILATTMTQALEWLRVTADDGNPSAQYRLGVCYEKGESLEQDKVLAAEWYWRAAEQGHAAAQSSLGEVAGGGGEVAEAERRWREEVDGRLQRWRGDGGSRWREEADERERGDGGIRQTGGGGGGGEERGRGHVRAAEGSWAEAKEKWQRRRGDGGRRWRRWWRWRGDGGSRWREKVEERARGDGGRRQMGGGGGGREVAEVGRKEGEEMVGGGGRKVGGGGGEVAERRGKRTEMAGGGGRESGGGGRRKWQRQRGDGGRRWTGGGRGGRGGEGMAGVDGRRRWTKDREEMVGGGRREVAVVEAGKKEGEEMAGGGGREVGGGGGEVVEWRKENGDDRRRRTGGGQRPRGDSRSQWQEGGRWRPRGGGRTPFFLFFSERAGSGMADVQAAERRPERRWAEAQGRMVIPMERGRGAEADRRPAEAEGRQPDGGCAGSGTEARVDVGGGGEEMVGGGGWAVGEAERRWQEEADGRWRRQRRSGGGRLYFLGEGVVKDEVTAVQWFRKAAENDHAMAQKHLGFCYETGAGVPKEPLEAKNWYERAAAQGDAWGQHKLGNMYWCGMGVPQVDKEAVKWFQKAACQGLQDAQSRLAIAYRDGRGVNQDPAIAEYWFRKAAEQGHIEAQRNLGVLLFEKARTMDIR